MSRKPRPESTKRNAGPAQVTLAAVLQVRDGVLQALLWQRALEPFAGAWALPGGVLSPTETLESRVDAATVSDGQTTSSPTSARTVSGAGAARYVEIASASGAFQP